MMTTSFSDVDNVFSIWRQHFESELNRQLNTLEQSDLVRIKNHSFDVVLEDLREETNILKTEIRKLTVGSKILTEVEFRQRQQDIYTIRRELDKLKLDGWPHQRKRRTKLLNILEDMSKSFKWEPRQPSPKPILPPHTLTSEDEFMDRTAKFTVEAYKDIMGKSIRKNLYSKDGMKQLHDLVVPMVLESFKKAHSISGPTQAPPPKSKSKVGQSSASSGSAKPLELTHKLESLLYSQLSFFMEMNQTNVKKTERLRVDGRTEFLEILENHSGYHYDDASATNKSQIGASLRGGHKDWIQGAQHRVIESIEKKIKDERQKEEVITKMSGGLYIDLFGDCWKFTLIKDFEAAAVEYKIKNPGWATTANYKAGRGDGGPVTDDEDEYGILKSSNRSPKSLPERFVVEIPILHEQDESPQVNVLDKLPHDGHDSARGEPPSELEQLVVNYDKIVSVLDFPSPQALTKILTDCQEIMNSPRPPPLKVKNTLTLLKHWKTKLFKEGIN